jgi:hypothetical protein
MIVAIKSIIVKSNTGMYEGFADSNGDRKCYTLRNEVGKYYASIPKFSTIL